MAGWRIERVNQLLLEEIAAVIQNVLRDPAIGFVTVLSVDTAPDLKNARVSVSRMGSDDEKRDAVAALNRAAPFIRRAIMPKVQLRVTPLLAFELDETAERAARIAKLLQPGARAEGDIE